MRGETEKVVTADEVLGLLRKYVLMDEEVLLAWTKKVADKGLVKDAADAFEWSDGAFLAAADLEVHRLAIRALTSENPMTLVELRDYAHLEAMRGARHPRHSTSQPSNLMRVYKTAAWASLVDPISGILSGILSGVKS